MEDLVGYIIGIPLVLFTLYLCLAIPYSVFFKPLFKSTKNKSHIKFIKNVNEEFLNSWKDFPGPKYLKFLFVLIGLYGWIEMTFFPKISFLNDLAMYLWGGGIFFGFISILLLFGLLACSIYWFPTYVWTMIKEIRK